MGYLNVWKSQLLLNYTVKDRILKDFQRQRPDRAWLNSGKDWSKDVDLLFRPNSLGVATVRFREEVKTKKQTTKRRGEK